MGLQVSVTPDPVILYGSEKTFTLYLKLNNLATGTIYSPYAVAFAAAARHLYPYTTEQADYFGNTVFVKDYAGLNDWGKDLHIGENEKACLLQNHGALTFGRDCHEAVKLAIALENIAKKNHLIETLMRDESQMKMVRLPIFEVNKWHERYNNVYGQRNTSDRE